MLETVSPFLEVTEHDQHVTGGSSSYLIASIHDALLTPFLCQPRCQGSYKVYPYVHRYLAKAAWLREPLDASFWNNDGTTTQRERYGDRCQSIVRSD